MFGEVPVAQYGRVILFTEEQRGGSPWRSGKALPGGP